MPASKIKLLATAPSADDVTKAYETARGTLTDKLDVPVGRLPDKDLKEIAEQVTKQRKNADFKATFDGEWLTFEASVGSWKTDISSANVLALGDARKQYEVLKKLAAFGLASTPVDPEDTARKQKRAVDIERDLEAIQGFKDTYSKLTYATIEGGIYARFEEWAAKRSQKHYLDFLGHLHAKTKPQQIYDNYIKKGAKFPVNLPAGVVSAIEKDLAGNKTPNFAAAQKDITQVVDSKMIPPFKAMMLGEAAEGTKRLQAELATLKKDLKLVGAR